MRHSVDLMEVTVSNCFCLHCLCVHHLEAGPLYLIVLCCAHCGLGTICGSIKMWQFTFDDNYIKIAFQLKADHTHMSIKFSYACMSLVLTYMF